MPSEATATTNSSPEKYFRQKAGDKLFRYNVLANLAHCSPAGPQGVLEDADEMKLDVLRP